MFRANLSWERPHRSSSRLPYLARTGPKRVGCRRRFKCPTLSQKTREGWGTLMESVELLVAQGDHGIDLGRAPCRDVTGQQRGGDQQSDHCSEGQRVRSSNLEQ